MLSKLVYNSQMANLERLRQAVEPISLQNIPQNLEQLVAARYLDFCVIIGVVRNQLLTPITFLALLPHLNRCVSVDRRNRLERDGAQTSLLNAITDPDLLDLLPWNVRANLSLADIHREAAEILMALDSVDNYPLDTRYSTEIIPELALDLTDC